MLGKPGGIAVAAALEAASQNLESLRGAAFDEVAKTAAKLHELVSHDSFDRDEVYRTANELLGHASTFGWSDVSEVASSLCDYVDSKEPMQARIAQLFTTSICALIQLDKETDESARREIVGSLKKLSQRSAK